MYHEALQVSKWKVTIDLEYGAMMHYNTWDLALHPTDVNIVRCKYAYNLKYHLDGVVAHCKALLVVTRFTKIRGMNFTKAIPPIESRVHFDL